MSVADCERVQLDWFRARAILLGGEVWADGSLTWTDGPDGQNLMFPTDLAATQATRDAVARGLDRARSRGHDIVGAWLGADVDAGVLAAAGFERGWSPWWMTADLSDPALAGPPDPRVRLQLDNDAYSGKHRDYRDQLALAREVPAPAWYAAAYTESRAFAGQAWSFLDGDLAGVFDMAVWERFQRRGLGTGLLRAVCAAARDAGARHAVLNATPKGEKLYETCGFTRIGEGITWWRHLG